MVEEESQSFAGSRASLRQDLIHRMNSIASRRNLLHCVHQSQAPQTKRAIVRNQGPQPIFACVPLAHPISTSNRSIPAKKAMELSCHEIYIF